MAEKKYIIDDAELMAEWDWVRNKESGLDPKKLSHGSTKKAHWICSQNHEFVARIDHRCIMGSGCPYCAGKLPIVGENDLATLNPELLKEWNYTKNSCSPTQYRPGSNKKVWWKCAECGCEWETKIINRTLKGSNCPECSKKIKKESRIKTYINNNGSLAEKSPDLISEWNYDRNSPLTPNMVTNKSGKIVWWKCKDCGYEWQARIADRTYDGGGCPVCTAKRVVEGYTDFATRYPELLDEWHPTMNEKINPHRIMPFVNDKVWWKCKDCGYEWECSLRSRTRLNIGCPACAKRIVVEGENDLATTHPHLAKEWHPNNNGDLLPTNVTSGSNKKAWWICSNGHEWQAVISSRAVGRGCPECAKERFTSFPEQAILYYLSKVTQTENRKKIHGYELDIYLPKLLVGIEYNGYYFHQNRKDFDVKKSQELELKGIKVIRIEECQDFSKTSFEKEDNIIVFKNYKNKKALNGLIHSVLKKLSLPDVDINVDRDSVQIYEQYIETKKSNSVAQKYPRLVEEWNYERNGRLSPHNVSYGSDKKVWWKCKVCGYEWQAAVSSRKTNGCPECGRKQSVKSRQKIILNESGSLADNYPDLAKEWHPTKNIDLLPTEITAGSEKKVWWLGKCGHEWEAVIYSRVAGRGCPICAKKKKI